MVVSGDRRAAGKWLVTVLVTLPTARDCATTPSLLSADRPQARRVAHPCQPPHHPGCPTDREIGLPGAASSSGCRHFAGPASALLGPAEWLAFFIEGAVPDATDERLAEVDACGTTRRRAATEEASMGLGLQRSAVWATPCRHRLPVYVEPHPGRSASASVQNVATHGSGSGNDLMSSVTTSPGGTDVPGAGSWLLHKPAVVVRRADARGER